MLFFILAPLLDIVSCRDPRGFTRMSPHGTLATHHDLLHVTVHVIRMLLEPG
jgi:hypothetical protein